MLNCSLRVRNSCKEMIDKRIIFKNLEASYRGSIVSTKPSLRRTGIESWFPYYAGYSTQFVEETLQALAVRHRARVLDPWNGSGTTTAVADRLGSDAIGFDINPVAVLVASARLVRAQDAMHSDGLVQEILSIADRFRYENALCDPLAPWLSRRVRGRFRAIEAAILELLAKRDGKRLDPIKDAIPPFASFLMLSLIRAARKFVQKVNTSNPTWSQPERAGDTTQNRLDNEFVQMVRICAEDVGRELLLSSARLTASYSQLADSRYLPLESSSVDTVITSPPYCTRLDYVKATEFELASLGVSTDDNFYRLLRESAMGTNLIRENLDIECSNLPGKVNSVLRQIAGHQSKASNGYYRKHFNQYFNDAQRSIQEIERVLKPGGTSVFVIQTSYYKEIPIKLGELYVAMAKHAGLDCKIVHRIPVNKVLSSINSRATKYLEAREYSEDVVAAVKAV